jgi:hypothetical protein
LEYGLSDLINDGLRDAIWTNRFEHGVSSLDLLRIYYNVSPLSRKSGRNFFPKTSAVFG